MSKPQPGETTNFDVYIEQKRTQTFAMYTMGLLAAVASAVLLQISVVIASAVWVASLALVASGWSILTRTPLTALLERIGDTSIDTLTEAKSRRDEMRADGGGEQ